MLVDPSASAPTAAIGTLSVAAFAADGDGASVIGVRRAVAGPGGLDGRVVRSAAMIGEGWLEPLVRLAGAGQLALVAGSLAIPRQLGWREKLAGTSPLIRQMFWVYAGYILATNLGFGLISALAPGLLLDRSPLAACVCGFIAIYWASRVVIQWTYFDLSELPRTPFNTLARWSLEGLFVALALVYGAATWANCGDPGEAGEAHARRE